ncbi:hypothetical protein [Halocatena pleomorpha]|uniref:Uncharacterized protein n=1 Tax=Halocatena pleomorpha TaxID=1785090 RepID=A0A3P3RNR5_9EURY|nr:hypothetical protein [Halocatena pleomorpha]RRJ34013.1 hypothetical protein EIK79_00365 [Halocatena pleomorpha]
MSTNTGKETKGVGGGGDSSVKSASAAVLVFVGGKDENVDDRNSVFPDTSPPVLGMELPIDDTMFYGDGIGELPETLTEAVAAEKNVDGLDGTYNKFRFKNSVQIYYDTTEEGEIKNGTVRITVNSQKDGDTVEVADNTSESIRSSFTSPQDLFLPNSPEQPSYTILADDWKDSDIFDLLFGSQKKRAAPYPRHMDAEKDKFQSPNSGLVEGIRVATIWGSANPYTKKMTNPSEIPFLDGEVPDNPIIYNWIELTLLTDGTTYVRVPDASVFPKHVGYLRSPLSNGRSTKRTTSGLRYILDETVTTADDTYDAAIREDSNNVWDRFKQETEQSYVVPYKSINSIYRWSYDSVDSPLYDHPVMAYGEADDGSELGREEVLDKLPDNPLFPMPNDFLVDTRP